MNPTALFPTYRANTAFPLDLSNDHMHEVKNNIIPEEAQRTKSFVAWIKNTWDEPRDNIFVWDFYQLETEGGLFMADKNAAGPSDSHPTVEFAAHVAPLFAQFIIDVADGKVN